MFIFKIQPPSLVPVLSRCYKPKVMETGSMTDWNNLIQDFPGISEGSKWLLLEP